MKCPGCSSWLDQQKVNNSRVLKYICVACRIGIKIETYNTYTEETTMTIERTEKAFHLEPYHYDRKLATALLDSDLEFF